MKMKTLLFAILLFASSGFAQTDYDQDGTYWGPDYTSVNVDFTQPTSNFPDPIADETIRQYDCLGLIKYTINQTTVGGVTTKRLFNNNPEINGKKNNTSGGAPLIYFPKLANGAGKIRIKGWITGTSNQPMQLSTFNYDEAEAEWVWKQQITIPAANGTNMVEANINIEQPVQLRLLYDKTAWISILSIEVSAYGEELTTLPLTLLGYNASLENVEVKNRWSTTNEVNTSHFVVERSSNGADFIAVGEVKAQNTSGQHDYFFTDPLPSYLRSEGTLYYRLQQVDTDGKNSYSQIVPVKVKLGNKITFSPNPAKDYLHVYAPNSKSLSVISTNGTEVFSTTLNTKQENFTVHLGSLAKGIYLAKITDTENRIIVEKILIE